MSKVIENFNWPLDNVGKEAQRVIKLAEKMTEIDTEALSAQEQEIVKTLQKLWTQVAEYKAFEEPTGRVFEEGKQYVVSYGGNYHIDTCKRKTEQTIRFEHDYGRSKLHASYFKGQLQYEYCDQCHC